MPLILIHSVPGSDSSILNRIRDLKRTGEVHLRIPKVGFEPYRRPYVDSEVEQFGRRSSNSVMRDRDPDRSRIRSGGFRRKRSRSSSTESVVRRQSAVRNDRRTRDGGFEPSGSPSDLTIRYQFPGLRQGIIGPTLLGPTVPDLILRGLS